MQDPARRDSAIAQVADVVGLTGVGRVAALGVPVISDRGVHTTFISDSEDRVVGFLEVLPDGSITRWFDLDHDQVADYAIVTDTSWTTRLLVARGGLGEFLHDLLIRGENPLCYGGGTTRLLEDAGHRPEVGEATPWSRRAVPALTLSGCPTIGGQSTAPAPGLAFGDGSKLFVDPREALCRDGFDGPDHVLRPLRSRRWRNWNDLPDWLKALVPEPDRPVAVAEGGPNPWTPVVQLVLGSVLTAGTTLLGVGLSNMSNRELQEELQKARFEHAEKMAARREARDAERLEELEEQIEELRERLEELEEEAERRRREAEEAEDESGDDEGGGGGGGGEGGEGSSPGPDGESTHWCDRDDPGDRFRASWGLDDSHQPSEPTYGKPADDGQACLEYDGEGTCRRRANEGVTGVAAPCAVVQDASERSGSACYSLRGEQSAVSLGSVLGIELCPTETCDPVEAAEALDTP